MAPGRSSSYPCSDTRWQHQQRPARSGSGYTPLGARRALPSSSGALTGGVLPLHLRRRTITRLCQKGILAIILVTIVINVIFILDTTRRLRSSSKTTGAESEGDVVERRNTLRLQQSRTKSLTIEVYSSQTRAAVLADGATILETNDERKGRGIHVLVLHQSTGAILAQRLFDTYSPHEDEALTLFVSMVSDGRIVIFAVKDEGTFQLKSPARDMLTRLGSQKAAELGWRDMWAFVAVKGDKALAESHSRSAGFNTWAAPLLLRAEVPLVPPEDTECSWPDSEETRRRRDFCDTTEGYGSVCACAEPAPLQFDTQPISDSHVAGVPVLVISSNRPHYLYRMLRSLLSARGVDASMITIFIDGYFDEPLKVARLFGLRGIQHTPIGINNARISQHYKAALTASFNLYPAARHAILIEEDLDVSPDFFLYFHQTLPLLDQDRSLFCVSAWNDQGYEHTASNVSKLYRVETMPGLGWALRRELYKNELEPAWPTPDKLWDWDMWMRMPYVRKGRECVIPDVSRTYHFGSTGINMNSYFQDHYFKHHAFNVQDNVQLSGVDSLKKDAYEREVNAALRAAVVMDESLSPCDEAFSSNLSPKGNVLFISMKKEKDTSTWLKVAKCLKVWDLDARGYHRGLWRLHFAGVPLMVVGVPYSPYSRHKPVHLAPLDLSDGSAPDR